MVHYIKVCPNFRIPNKIQPTTDNSLDSCPTAGLEAKPMKYNAFTGKSFPIFMIAVQGIRNASTPFVG